MTTFIQIVPIAMVLYLVSNLMYGHPLFRGRAPLRAVVIVGIGFAMAGTITSLLGVQKDIGFCLIAPTAISLSCAVDTIRHRAISQLNELESVVVILLFVLGIGSTGVLLAMSLETFPISKKIGSLAGAAGVLLLSLAIETFTCRRKIDGKGLA